MEQNENPRDKKLKREISYNEASAIVVFRKMKLVASTNEKGEQISPEQYKRNVAQLIGTIAKNQTFLTELGSVCQVFIDETNREVAKIELPKQIAALRVKLSVENDEEARKKIEASIKDKEVALEDANNPGFRAKVNAEKKANAKPKGK